MPVWNPLRPDARATLAAGDRTEGARQEEGHGSDDKHPQARRAGAAGKKSAEEGKGQLKGHVRTTAETDLQPPVTPGCQAPATGSPAWWANGGRTRGSPNGAKPSLRRTVTKPAPHPHQELHPESHQKCRHQIPPHRPLRSHSATLPPSAPRGTVQLSGPHKDDLSPRLQETLCQGKDAAFSKFSEFLRI